MIPRALHHAGILLLAVSLAAAPAAGLAKSIPAGTPYTDEVKGYDPDAEDTVSCTKTGGPAGLQITAKPDNTGCDISWREPVKGTYTVAGEISSDAPDAKTTPFSYTLTVANTPPVFATTTLPAMTEGTAYSQTGTCTDQDGDALTVTVSGARPPGLEFADNGDGTWTFSGTPDYVVNWKTDGLQKTYTVTVRCDDGADATEQTFDLVVRQNDRPFVITSQPQ